MTVLVGRGTPEKVTAESSFSTIEGPMPFTLCKPSKEPNGPNESRSATMRLASAGPTCLSATICSTLAVSRSTGPDGLGGVFFVLVRLDLRRPDFRAESAARIWDSSAERALASFGLALWSVRIARPDAPRTRTIEKKMRALRSAEVGIIDPNRSPRDYVTGAARVGAYCSIEVVRRSVDSTSTPATTNGNPSPR